MVLDYKICLQYVLVLGVMAWCLGVGSLLRDPWVLWQLFLLWILFLVDWEQLISPLFEGFLDLEEEGHSAQEQ